MHSRVTLVQAFLGERKTVVKANGKVMSQAVTEANAGGIESRVLYITRLRILHVRMTVIEKHEELQLVAHSLDIENVGQWN